MRQLAVVIGRFQPVHVLHVDKLLSRARSYVETLILLGSSLKTRDQKNPLRWDARADLIRTACFGMWGQHWEGVEFAPIKDYPRSNTRWVMQVQRLVKERIEDLENETGEEWEPVLVGVDSDETSFYLKLFPQWKRDVFTLPRDTPKVSATDIRNAMFRGDWDSIREILPPGCKTLLQNWLKTPEGKRIQEEFNAAIKNKLVLAYEAPDGTLTKAKFAPTFHTADNVVVWRGNVLLIRRRSAPGKGLWALPGGFIGEREWIKDSALRELAEESKIKIWFYANGVSGRKLPLRIDPAWRKADQVFDQPGRSLAGRRITTAYLWVIPDEYELSIKPGDDAAKAQWYPIYEVLNDMDYVLFEDHQSIVAHLALGADQ